eukprot:TRINITY_DN1153_c0_g1_i3.p2 TRINITY_DN1153_c0_g1~~TRINITY_DN1153_c0_g1_i3.p2  ORF type:complete len:177 (+),score=67.03 TRINITY_DN1153_c0_g1_i3:773-1303(+)
MNDQTTNKDGATKQEEIVMQLSGCKNLQYVKLVLQYNAYDTDATVEALVAEFNANGGFSFEVDEKDGAVEAGGEVKSEVPESASHIVEDASAPAAEVIPEKRSKAVMKENQTPAEMTLSELRRKTDLSNKDRKLLRQLEKKEKEGKKEKRKEKAKTRPRGNDGPDLPQDDVGSIAI